MGMILIDVSHIVVIQMEVINFNLFLGGKMSFPDFLDVMHKHSQVENIPDEILKAFKGHDPKNTGSIPAKELKHIL